MANNTPRTKRSRGNNAHAINPAEPPRTLTLLGGAGYIDAEHTNVLRTFKRLGWIPPSQLHTVKTPMDTE